MEIQIKRVYEPASVDDGYRVLIDRLWPRGVAREEARIDEWARDLAPSHELRRWFGHDPAKFDEFRRRYVEELRDASEHIEDLRRRAERGPLTIVFGAKDAQHSNAAVLEVVLKSRL
jgi:uncharacterized protein YeaO (DUF488 family)